MSRDKEISYFKMKEAQYYKVYGSHIIIDDLLNRAHREERELTEEEYKLLEENAKNILEELKGFDALEITDDITIFSNLDIPPKNIATPMDVYFLEEKLGIYVPDRD